jgi:hypothetical protein
MTGISVEAEIVGYKEIRSTKIIGGKAAWVRSASATANYGSLRHSCSSPKPHLCTAGTTRIYAAVDSATQAACDCDDDEFRPSLDDDLLSRRKFVVRARRIE